MLCASFRFELQTETWLQNTCFEELERTERKGYLLPLPLLLLLQLLLLNCLVESPSLELNILPHTKRRTLLHTYLLSESMHNATRQSCVLCALMFVFGYVLCSRCCCLYRFPQTSSNCIPKIVVIEDGA